MSCPAAHPVPTTLASLEAGMTYRLTLIIAPEGSGKTSRLRQWSEWRSGTGQRAPFWASLTDQDNRLAFFLPHLASALAGLGAPSDGGLQSVSPSAERQGRTGSMAHLPLSEDFFAKTDAEDYLIDLINSLGQVPGEFALILDEYDRIRAPEIHQAIDFLLEYLPPRMHLYLAARREPPLRLARLRARRQMIETSPAGL